MLAMGIEDFGDPQVLVPMKLRRPTPLPTEIAVRVHAAGINPLDYRTRGGFPTPAVAALGSPPHILGWDVSGVVEEVGHGVTKFEPGDEVFGMPWLPRPAGAYAEFVTAPSRQFSRKPDALDHTHAAALPLAGLTAWQTLTEVSKLQPGERILIHAAGGGVGHLAVQIAKHLGGHVIGTASAPKHAWLRNLGADELIDYHSDSFEDVARDVDVVLDLVGIVQPDTALRSLKVLRPQSRFLGIAPRQPDELVDRAQAAGIHVVPEFLVEPDGDGLAHLAHLVDMGALCTHVDQTFPLTEAAEAHTRAERSGARKLVLQVVN